MEVATNLTSDISIHAPAKGATYNLTNAGIVRLFQSTLPRRERLFVALLPKTLEYFNPRSREGSDCIACTADPAAENFNPRSREGSDTSDFSDSKFAFYFNPRSREGSDRASIVYRGRCWDFNPRSREGSDQGPAAACLPQNNFNPRSREGSDIKLHYCFAIL